MWKVAVRFLVLVLVAWSVTGGGTENDGGAFEMVKNLPGQPAVTFKHYAGYVRIREQDEKALFYWFFEAQNNVSQRPLVLWLNGGPGCSSIAYGAAQELGPFLVRNNSELVLNKFSWNKVANLLFLEAPIGVGFSYSNRSGDFHTLGDRVTAEDSHAFLVEWFKRFPQFKSHDFFITGESYAGHYVPQLADIIYRRNRRTKTASYINLKGFMIGNAVLNDGTDDRGFVEYAWTHGIISDQIYHNVLKKCDFNRENQTKSCLFEYRKLLLSYSNIDIYNIYAPVCLSSSGGKTSRKQLLMDPRILTQHDRLLQKLPSGYDPCTEDYVTKYFNREDVQRALHANVTKLPYPYSTCSKVIKKWNDSADTVLPIIQKLLIEGGLRIWIYSGDTDGRVPVTSTRYSVNAMKMKVKEEWRAWFHHQVHGNGGHSNVAGWVETYEGGITLATVRGAGHQVPVFKPHQSLSLLSHFLSGTALPALPPFV